MRLAASLLLLVSTVAAADDDPPALDSLTMGSDENSAGPAFAWTGSGTFYAAKTTGDAADDRGSLQDKMTMRELAAWATDKKAIWISADLSEFEIGCGMAPCPPPPPPPKAEAHATVLWERKGNAWSYVAWHVAPVVDRKAQAAAFKAGVMPDALIKKIDGADEVVKVFEASIVDAKKLAATFSDRKDVLLYGSEAPERFVGAKAKTQLASWGLAFKVRDGIRAGMTASKSVAWVAANLDASSAKRPKDKPVPYRAFFIYEKKGADWKIVNASFSVVTRAK